MCPVHPDHPYAEVNYTQSEDSNTQTTPSKNFDIHNFEYQISTYYKSTTNTRDYLNYFNKSSQPIRCKPSLYTNNTNINLNSMKMNLTTSEKNRGIVRFLLMSMLLCLLIHPAQAQDRVTVTGRLTDTSHAPLIGASVIEQGTTNGVTTDTEGNYQISVSGNATLGFSFIGYKPQSVAVLNRHRDRRHAGGGCHDDRRSRSHRLRFAAQGRPLDGRDDRQARRSGQKPRLEPGDHPPGPYAGRHRTADRRPDETRLVHHPRPRIERQRRRPDLGRRRTWSSWTACPTPPT